MIPRQPDTYDNDGNPRLPAMSAVDATVLSRAAKLAYERSGDWIVHWDNLSAKDRDRWRLAVLPLVSDLQFFCQLAGSVEPVNDRDRRDWQEAVENAREDAGLGDS